MKPIFLLIDTSSFESSVALWNGNTDSLIIERGNEKGFAERIPSVVSQLLDKSDLTLSALSAVVVNAGPGSYTGLRTGISFAKGLCYGLNIPFIAINSLLVLATKFSSELSGNYYLLPMIDAGRMEVYTAMFNQQLEELAPTAPLIVEDNFMDQFHFKNVYYMGSGALKCKEIFQRKGWVYLNNEVSVANDLIKPALVKFAKGDYSSLYSFEPLYLKEFMLQVKKNS